MGLTQFFVTPHFAGPREIRDAVRLRYEAKPDDFADGELLLIFETSKQQTWLMATDRALYCVTERIDDEHADVRWRISKSEIISDGGFILPIRTEDKSESSGYVTFNGKRARLYSKRLFTDVPIERRVKSMLLKAFNVSISG
jgi:hypothetical protein